MKSRWVLVSALLILCTLALSSAATTASPSAPAETNAVVAAAPAAQPAVSADPYLKASAIATSAPEERASCQRFAQTCKFDGGPCGPVPNTCHCLFGPDGWICAR